MSFIQFNQILLNKNEKNINVKTKFLNRQLQTYTNITKRNYFANKNKNSLRSAKRN